MASNNRLPPPRVYSTLDRPVGRPDRSIASAPKPATNQGQSQRRSDVYTYFTKVGVTDKLYDGSRLWVRIRLTLETAGPVAYGLKSNLIPVLSGKGVLLETDEPMEIELSKGDVLYIAANAVSRVKVEITAIPWLEQISGTLDSLMNNVQMMATSILDRIAGK